MRHYGKNDKNEMTKKHRRCETMVNDEKEITKKLRRSDTICVCFVRHNAVSCLSAGRLGQSLKRTPSLRGVRQLPDDEAIFHIPKNSTDCFSRRYRSSFAMTGETHTSLRRDRQLMKSLIEAACPTQ